MTTIKKTENKLEWIFKLVNNENYSVYEPFFSSSSILALKMLHFIWSGGIVVAPPANLTWLFLKLLMSGLGRSGTVLCLGADSSRPFSLAWAISEASIVWKLY